jgi:NADH-quinone oxidoreductase subunit L
MFLAMGVGAWGAGIFHLYTHAFFKALLFLGSGAVIHALHGEQDIRNMGGLRKYLPITYWTFLIGSLAIAGVPFLSGFFSKDEILYETFHEGHTILWTIGALTSLLTATYMFRLVFLTFHGERRGKVAHTEHSDGEEHPAHPAHPGHLHDAPPAMAFALVILAIGSVLAGYIGVPHALGGHNALGEWLAPSFAVPGGAHEAGAEVDSALEIRLMMVSSAIGLLGIGLAWFLWTKRRDIVDGLSRRFHGVHTLLLNKYYVDEIYETAVVQPVKVISRDGLWRGFDVGVIDGAVNGAGTIVAGGAWALRRLQTGSVRAYAGSLFVGVVLILGYCLWR